MSAEKLEESTLEVNQSQHGAGGLQRKLKERHVQMISIGGVIGTGLFLGTATSLSQGGPGGLLLGYVIMGSVCVSVMVSLGELITLLPVAGGQIALSGRFVDPALSFALGWNYWYASVVALPAEISAAAVLINYWIQTVNVLCFLLIGVETYSQLLYLLQNAAWITVTLSVAVTINFLGVRAFGEAEFWFASIKVVTIVGLMILGLVIDLGGGPDHDRRGFRYWHDPGTFTNFHGIPGAKGHFLGFLSVLIQAAYAFLGTEVVGLTAAETHNPTKNIPLAIRGVYLRILIFYVLGVFVLGLICPSNNPDLTTSKGTVASSAWVIAIRIARIKVLPSIINAAFLTSAWSAGSSDIYGSSRILFGLAKIGHAPKILLRTNRYGTPYMSILVSSLFGLLSYMKIQSGPSKVFNWLSNMTAVAGMLNWMGICITHIRFRQGLAAQGLGTDIIPYKTVVQPYAAYYALFWIIITILFAKWDVFLTGNWVLADFITTYFPVPFFILLYLLYKLYIGTKLIPLKEMDFTTDAYAQQ